jgi:hypothetical protein
MGEPQEVFPVEETIERHPDPSEEGYRRADRLRRGHTLESISLPGLTPSVDELLG